MHQNTRICHFWACHVWGYHTLFQEIYKFCTNVQEFVTRGISHMLDQMTIANEDPNSEFGMPCLGFWGRKEQILPSL